MGRLLVFARVRTIVFARGWIQSFLHAGVSYERNLMHIYIYIVFFYFYFYFFILGMYFFNIFQRFRVTPSGC